MKVISDYGDEYTYDGNLQAQMAPNGALILAEATPDIAKGGEGEVVKMKAIFAPGEWTRVED
jgi:hypothetical protein